MVVKVGGLVMPVTGKTCLSHLLQGSPFLAIQRDINTNTMTISPSPNRMFTYSIHEGVEHLDGVALRHKQEGCPG